MPFPFETDPAPLPPCPKRFNRLARGAGRLGVLQVATAGRMLDNLTALSVAGVGNEAAKGGYGVGAFNVE
jgi:hypothetical protein